MNSTIEDQGASGLIRGVERAFRDGTVAGLPEAELVRRFAEEGQEAAFAAIVERHGRMVLGVCRRILGPSGGVDADDAFQATFLVLVRRRRSLRGAGALGPWLHGVARKVASRARADSIRRRLREPLGARPEGVAALPERSAECDELRAILDEEIGRLPEKYRQPVILCDLEGLPQDDAARRLCWTAGALRGRLDRARLKLRGRLARRGLAPAASAMAAGWLGSSTEAAVSPSLRSATAAAMARDLAVERVARAVAPSTAARLAGAFVRRQILTRAAAIAFLAIGASAIGVAALGRIPRPGLESSAARPDGETREVEIQVVGPDGRAIPRAPVRLRTYPIPGADAVRRGSFARREGDAVIVDADEEGRMALRLPAKGNSLDVAVSMAGYGYYNANWRTKLPGQEIPSPLKIQLENAWTVNGVVLDPDGNPLEGAVATLRLPGRTQSPGRGILAAKVAVKTDGAGLWHYDRVPESLANVPVSVTYQGLAGLNSQIPRRTIGRTGSPALASRLYLRRGRALTGTVRDESGRPIAGARVLAYAVFGANSQDVTTGPDGTFRADGCLPGRMNIIATAPGYALDFRTVDLDLNAVTSPAPVELRLKPARPLRVRMIDHDGKPVSNAAISRVRIDGRWLSQNSLGLMKRSDDDGGWEWFEAPPEEIAVDVEPPGEDQRIIVKVPARAGRPELRLPPPLIVTGRVIDAESRQPLAAFRAVPGSTLERTTTVIWEDGHAVPGRDGHFEYRPGLRGEDIVHLTRIEADGYRSTESRQVHAGEGRVTLDFALTKAFGIMGRVIGPDGQPAAGAQVAIATGRTAIEIRNGEIMEGTSYRTVIADPDGTFRLALPNEKFRIAITHASGFAWLDSARDGDWDRVRLIRLEPWSRVEGTFRVGARPVANAALAIKVGGLLQDGVYLATRHSETTTGPDGRYVFERVFPGRWSIGRFLPPPDEQPAEEAVSGQQIEAEFRAGQTLHQDLGGTGLAVIGRLRLADGLMQKVNWRYAWITGVAVTKDGDQTPPEFCASVGPDGRFRIDDLLPGRYRLYGYFTIAVDMRGAHGRRVSCEIHFDVPPEGRTPAGKEVDLGLLTLDEH